MRKIFRKLTQALHVGEDVEFLSTLLDWIGLKPKDLIVGAIGGAIIGYVKSLSDSSPADLLLYGLAGIAIILAVIAASRVAFARYATPTQQSQPVITEDGFSCPALLPNVSARDVYFRVLEASEWKNDQLRKTIDTSNLRRDWLEFRLQQEIHKALRNDRLNAWGEECLHGMVTTPEKPIPATAWDRIELIFDNNPNLPRTSAYFKGPTTFQKGKSAWNGVKFNEAQFFILFPLGSQEQELRPMWEAIGHVARCIGDTDTKGYLPKARIAIRQRALDNKIKIRGRKSGAPMAAGLRWSEVETGIPPSYWETADVHVTAAALDAGDSPQTFPHRYSDGWFGSDKIFLYANLRVDWPEILREWP